MSRSLIRKNQLHPDIADLISGYGDNFFITPIELQQILLNLEAALPFDSVIFNTGNQNISGSKTFFTRPNVSGVGVSLENEIPQNIVYQTGEQNISGAKSFFTRPNVSGIGVLLQGEATQGGNVENVVYATGNQTISGNKDFTSRPSLNGIGFATTGEVGGASTAFDGTRPITLQVNGFKDLEPNGDNVVTFLNNLFYPFVQATVTLNSFPLQELGTSITGINYIGTITRGSLTFGTDINNLTPFVNNNARSPIILIPSTSFNTLVNFGSPLASTVSNCFVRINSKDINNNIVTVNSNSQTITFEAPTYAGSGALNLTDDGLTLRNVLSGQSSPNNNGKYLIFKPASRTINFTTNGYYYFIYPNSWGSLTQIKDAALGFNFNINTDFTTNTMQVPLINGTNHLYRWYRNTNAITLNNYGVTYVF
jgi:hypothetical protein